MLIYGDGTVFCCECEVALCDTDDRFCSACGAPLRSGLSRSHPETRAISIALARIQAISNKKAAH